MQLLRLLHAQTLPPRRHAGRAVWWSMAVAAALWFLMFSPWTKGLLNFWYTMAASGIVLSALSVRYGRDWFHDVHISLRSLLLGLAIAFVLWWVFWTGDKVSQLLFGFARPQVDLIYGMKGSTPPAVIGALLLCVIGPAEEIFWRGFVQRRLMQRYGMNAGFVVATLCYTLIHIWSFNLMLVLAAMVCGILWGGIYRLWPRAFFPLLLSHAVWDCAAFVVFPF